MLSVMVHKRECPQARDTPLIVHCIPPRSNRFKTSDYPCKVKLLTLHSITYICLALEGHFNAEHTFAWLKSSHLSQYFRFTYINHALLILLKSSKSKHQVVHEQKSNTRSA